VRIVLDSSVAIAWCIPGQGNPTADRLLNLVRLEGALVPRTWHLEVGNILGLKLRDGNLSETTVQLGLGLLQSLDIATDSQHAPFGAASFIGQIIRFQLAAYDALYVELALRTGAPLATFDKAMIASAKQYGVEVLSTT
jgi:predicted nucleic acid-binding protein